MEEPDPASHLADTIGWLEEHLIECPLHNGQFDVRTGEGQGAPITKNVKVYLVRLDGREILTRL